MDKTSTGGEKMANYDNLSPKLLDLAYDQNELYDAKQDFSRLGREVSRKEALLQADEQMELVNLSAESQDGIYSDEVIQYLHYIFVRFGDVKSDWQLERMLRLRDRLVPGEIFMSVGSNSPTVETIAEIDGSDEGHQVAQPWITKDWNLSDFQPDLGMADKLESLLAWSVPVEGKVGRLTVDMRDAVGHKDIKQYLDNDLYLAASALVDPYEAIGEHEIARKYRKQVVAYALEILHETSDATTVEQIKSLEILSRVEPEALDSFIAGLAIDIAQDPTNLNPHLFGSLKSLVAYSKLQAGETRADGNNVEPSEIFKLFLHYEEKGQRLLTGQDRTIQ